MIMKLSQKNFDILVENLNHKVTSIESDIVWIKRIGYYLAGAVSVSLGWGVFV